jgi:hypothetical protein
VRNDLVGDGATGQRHGHHGGSRDGVALAHGIRHGTALAKTRANAALTIADNNHGIESEVPAALDHLGHTADLDHLLLQVALVVTLIPE